MYFLAIVAKEDLLHGNIVPSYILCKSSGTSTNRSKWRVYRANAGFTCTKVLTRWPSGNDTMVEFLSKYRTRDHMHKSQGYSRASTRKYYPEGALFWFECNQYGEAIGPAVFVKRVPDKTKTGSDLGKQIFDEATVETPSVPELFSRDPWSIPLVTSNVKPKLFQWVNRDSNKK